VQIFAGKKNVAVKKPAQQSSVMFNGTADLAVDGIVGNADHPTMSGVGFAHTQSEPSPAWWEVDLGEDVPIERIVIWNRLWDGIGLANHRLMLLDPARNVRWEHTGQDIPIPCAMYEFPFSPKRVQFSDVDATYAQRHLPEIPPKIRHLIDPPLDQGVAAWWAWDVPGQQQVATFTLKPGQNLAGKLVKIRLGHFTPMFYNIGRFRLAVTTTAPPVKSRRPVVIVPQRP
jgi:hypothetical protein